MATDFTSVPVIDWALYKSPDTKPQFLSELRSALIGVGFFYLKNHDVPEDVLAEFIRQGIAFFDLPIEKKKEVDIANSKHYLGYVGLLDERTAGKDDYRESFALGMDLTPPEPDEPEYHNLRGPNQWPDLPGFREGMKNYQKAINGLCEDFKVVLAEVFGLPPTALFRFFDQYPWERLKLAKYPAPSQSSGCNSCSSSEQGIGAHKDSCFLTFLVQATEHPGLEVQNQAGAWIPVPPKPGTLVVNIGRMMETLTGGLCIATTHRVRVDRDAYVDASGRDLGPRYSFPTFQLLSMDLRPEDMKLEIPPEVARLAPQGAWKSDSEHFLQPIFNASVGEGAFRARAIAHMRCAQRHWPHILAESVDARKKFGEE